MLYKPYKDGIQLSLLGMGNMRLPVRADEPGQPIDFDAAKRLIDHCMRLGINYYDTAYIYHAGESEAFVGKALSGYPRDSFYVADKFNMEANPDYRVQFAEQLRRLQMDRIDFYMLHGLRDAMINPALASGCVEYFDGLKREGKIRYLGFSYHGSPEMFPGLLSAYPWDFAQIQLNYYDHLYGDAKALYDMAAEAGVPIMAMEPARGGMLANLTERAGAVLSQASPDQTAASWAMRWVMGLENVQVVLSGMSDLAQLQDNARTFSQTRPLSERETKLIEQAADLQHRAVAVACSACRYCCPDCPKGLDIPRLIKHYNEAKIGGAWRLSSLESLPRELWPTACVECGACARHCPQSLAVPEFMREMKEMLT